MTEWPMAGASSCAVARRKLRCRRGVVVNDHLPEPEPNFERICDVLGSVAGTYPEDSEEARAIKEAAEAYLFLQLHLKLRSAYQAFRESAHGGLTSDQQQRLREVGIELTDD